MVLSSPKATVNCEGGGLAAALHFPSPRAASASPSTQARTVLLACSQVFHHRNRVLIPAPADLTIRGFILSSNLTSSFLKPSTSFSLEHVLPFPHQLGLYKAFPQHLLCKLRRPSPFYIFFSFSHLFHVSYLLQSFLTWVIQL